MNETTAWHRMPAVAVTGYGAFPGIDRIIDMVMNPESEESIARLANLLIA